MSPVRTWPTKSATPSTAGRPSERAMIAVWLSAPPSTVAKPPTMRGIHQRGIGRRQLLGDDDAAFRQVREGLVGRLREIADQPVADLADVLGARGEIGIVELARSSARPARSRRCTAASALTRLLGDALFDAAHARALPVSICRCASSRKPSSSAAAPGSAADLSLSFFELLLRLGDGGRRSARARPLDLIGLDLVFRHVD